jgi:hypothetical protein
VVDKFDVSVFPYFYDVNGADIKLGSTGQVFVDYRAPKILGIEPTSGDPEGNYVLTIVGENFDHLTLIAFVGKEGCGDLNVVSDTELTCVVPPGYGAELEISLTVFEEFRGISKFTKIKSGMHFSYDAPTVESINPGSTTARAGQVVTVTGTNFFFGLQGYRYKKAKLNTMKEIATEFKTEQLKMAESNVAASLKHNATRAKYEEVFRSKLKTMESGLNLQQKYVDTNEAALDALEAAVEEEMATDALYVDETRIDGLDLYEERIGSASEWVDAINQERSRDVMTLLERAAEASKSLTELNTNYPNGTVAKTVTKLVQESIEDSLRVSKLVEEVEASIARKTDNNGRVAIPKKIDPPQVKLVPEESMSDVDFYTKEYSGEVDATVLLEVDASAAKNKATGGQSSGSTMKLKDFMNQQRLAFDITDETKVECMSSCVTDDFLEKVDMIYTNIFTVHDDDTAQRAVWLACMDSCSIDYASSNFASFFFVEDHGANCHDSFNIVVGGSKCLVTEVLSDSEALCLTPTLSGSNLIVEVESGNQKSKETDVTFSYKGPNLRGSDKDKDDFVKHVILQSDDLYSCGRGLEGEHDKVKVVVGSEECDIVALTKDSVYCTLPLTFTVNEYGYTKARVYFGDEYTEIKVTESVNEKGVSTIVSR